MKIPLSDISIIYEPSFAGSNWTTWKLRHEPTGIEEGMDWESFEGCPEIPSFCCRATGERKMKKMKFYIDMYEVGKEVDANQTIRTETTINFNDMEEAMEFHSLLVRIARLASEMRS